MVIRTINWTVGEDMKVTPTKSQFAGVQGDHEVTRVTFILPTGLSYDAGNGAYLEFMSASGAYDKTDDLGIEYPSDETSGDPSTVSFLLPQAWTQEGGQATIRLVLLGITDYPEDKPPTAYTFEGKIHFEERQEAVSQVDRLIDGDIHRLMEQAKGAVSSSAAAVERADAANQSAEQALETAMSYVGEAGWCMDEAQKSADAAAKSAAVADSSAASADGSASAAAGSAAESKAAAEESAKNKEDVLNDKETVEALAGEVAANAETVAQRAEDAAASASVATEKAALAQERATSAEESADIAAEAEAHIEDMLKGFSVIGDVTLTEDVATVRFKQDEEGNPISDYKDFFLYFAGKFKNDLAGGQLTVASDSSYWRFAYRAYDQSSTVEQTFWCWVEEVATVTDRVIRRSLYPAELLTQGGVAMNASGASTNSPAISNLTVRSASRKLVDFYITVNGVNTIVSGSRVILLGRKKI